MLIPNTQNLLILMLSIKSCEPEKAGLIPQKGVNAPKKSRDLNENYIIRFSISKGSTVQFSNSYIQKYRVLCFCHKKDYATDVIICFVFPRDGRIETLLLEDQKEAHFSSVFSSFGFIKKKL